VTYWYDPDEIKAQALGDRTQPEFEQEDGVTDDLDWDSVDDLEQETTDFLTALKESTDRINETLGH
jgi:hypothetical protein